MALVLDEDQALLRQTALDFARTRLPVAELRRLRDGGDATGFDRAAWSEMAALGWTGMLIPEALGGNGFGHFGLGLVLEALGRTLAASPMLSTVVLSGTALTLTGPGVAAADVLRRIAAGEAVVAFAHEEQSRHSPYEVATTARRDGDGYVLDGRKRFVADGHVADTLLVVARTAGGSSHRDGLSLFLVEGAAAGVVTRRRLAMADSRNSADLELASVPAVLLGEEGAAGGALLERVLDVGRILLAAEMFGMAQQAFETTLDYLKQRQQFGVPIGSFQALQHRAVQMYTDIELARSVLYDALSALDDPARSADVPRLASVCKARVNDTLHLVSNEAVQLHGGIGMTDQADVGLYLKRARVAQATLGNSAFHRDRYATLHGF